MRVNGKDYRTVWMQGASVFLIEQNRLPFEFKIVEMKGYADTCNAICDMVVRGAGAIGVTAGFAMAQAFLQAPSGDIWTSVSKARKEIEATRPTAQNLFFAVKRVYDEAFKNMNDPAAAVNAAVKTAQALADKDADDSKKIGEFGSVLLHDGSQVATHCNAGWLAFTDYGTALSPVYQAHRNGKKIFVYADETRPRGQGARLTAWELKNEEVPHVIIPDNAAAYLMSQKKIDLYIVGADRIAANGDVANKIGTLEKAICAKEYGIPFYVAAPTSTFDLACATGAGIPIEYRNEDEVLYQSGTDSYGNVLKIRVASPGSSALNPAFDVTPAKLIAGIITEKGIIKPNENDIYRLFTNTL